MKTMSMFDIIGPNMVGPSSSHTAGALRIASLARNICEGGEIRQADFTLYGSFARTYRGHGTDRALVAGLLGFDTEDARIRDSFAFAQEAGLAYRFLPDAATRDVHPNTVRIRLTTGEGAVHDVTGVSIGGGNVVIRNINGVDVDFTGEYPTIIIRQADKPGVLAHITQCLTARRINIAYMKLYREDKGKMAYTIVEADERIEPGVLEAIKIHLAIESAILIQ